MKKTRPSVEDVDEPRLTVSGAARRLGIAPATLRTWDRRYGIGPTDHARGRHRRYSADDMARLELMQRALMQGAAPAEAARYARSAGLPLREAAPVDVVADRRHRRGRGGRRAARMAPVAVGSAVTGGAAQAGAAAVPRCGCPGPAPGPAGSAGPRWRWTRRSRCSAWSRSRSPRTGWSPPGTTWRARCWPRSGSGGRPPVAGWRSSTCSASVSSRSSSGSPGRGRPAAPQPVRPVLLAGDADRAARRPARRARRAAGRAGGRLPVARSRPARRRPRRGGAPDRARRRRALVADCRRRPTLGVVTGLPVTRPRYRTFVAGPGWDGAALPPGVGVLGSLVDAGERIAGAVLR